MSLIRKEITGTGVVIPGNDIDTDRIIPARFLKEITFDNMGNYLFYDVRFDEDGNEKEFPLNNKDYKTAEIMVVGKNFGCGSSREHAPQAIMRYGIKAIIGESFAEIFAGNCKALGVPTVTASESDIKVLRDMLALKPALYITIDIENKEARFNDTRIKIDLPSDRQNAFLAGTWSAIELLKKNQDLILKKDKALPY